MGKKGQEREKNRVKNGVKNGLEWGQKRVLNGKKTGISPNSTVWNGVEQPFFAVPHLSCRFLAAPPRFSPVFHDFGQKREKMGCPKMEERERKEHVPFPFLSRSRFFPFLAWHISIARHSATSPDFIILCNVSSQHVCHADWINL